MRIVSRTLLQLIWCGALAISLSLPDASAAAARDDEAMRKEGPVKLDPVKVATNPFANWGIGVIGRLNLLDKLAGKSPEELYVGLVYVKSPADVAGIRVGDRVTAINGTRMTELPWRELVKQLGRTETGEVVTVALYDEITNLNRRVDLKLRSARSWSRGDGSEQINFWGLLLSAEKPTGVNFDFKPKQKRLKEWAPMPVLQRRKVKGGPNPLEVAFDENGKMKTKLERVYVFRRTMAISWQGKPLTLVERDDRVVEVIEAEKAPEKDDVVGRLMHEGATLILHADGSYELNDAPPKSNAPQPPASDQPPAPEGATTAPRAEATDP